MRIALTGSHGLIGRALGERLRGAGHTVSAIPRVQVPAASGRDDLWYCPNAPSAYLGGVEGYDAIVHLAGEPIGERRWSSAVKTAIYASRAYGTHGLVEAMARMTDPPPLLVSASAIGWYGDAGAQPCDESHASGNGFLARVVRDWESAAKEAERFGTRVVLARTGVVLSREGGLVSRVLPLFRLGLGGRLGDGSQSMSWITLSDEVRAIEYLLTSALVGPVNLTAPSPVSNRVFTQTLASALHRPAVVSVPSVALSFVLGKEMAAELALVSQNVLPVKLEADGFAFSSTTIESAWSSLLG
ncbi:MAG: TIGR01777 family oxidoreductase [Ferrimicrobium sp.]